VTSILWDVDIAPHETAEERRRRVRLMIAGYEKGLQEPTRHLVVPWGIIKESEVESYRTSYRAQLDDSLGAANAPDVPERRRDFLLSEVKRNWDMVNGIEEALANDRWEVLYPVYGDGPNLPPWGYDRREVLEDALRHMRGGQ